MASFSLNAFHDTYDTDTIEMVVRAFDPCLSCAVHAVNGHMAMRVKVLNHLGETTQVIQNFDE